MSPYRQKGKRAPHLADGGPRQTKPDSMGHRIATTAMSAALAAQRGLTVPEHRVAFEAAHGPAPRTYLAQFHSLVARGILVAVAGRAGHLRFAHRDALVGQDDSLDDDDLVKVERALRSACARRHRAVTTREVTQEMAALGLALTVPHTNGVRQRLVVLSARRRRGRADWQPPRAERITLDTAKRHLSVRWRPAGSTVAVDVDAPSDRADAIRTIVGLVEDALRMPVTRDDCALWIAAHPDHPAVAALDGTRMTDVLHARGNTDRESALGRRLLRRDGDRTRDGRAAFSYHLLDAGRAPSVDGVLAHRLGEALDGLHPCVELAGIDLLRKRAARVGSLALVRLAEARRVALWAAVTHALVDAASEVEIDASDPAALYARAAAVIVAGTTVRAQWAATAAQMDHGARRGLARQISRQAAITALGAMPTEDAVVSTPMITVAGMASAVSLGELMPFVTSALREAGWRSDPLAMYRLFDGCRRYDDAAPVERFARSKTTGPRLRLDRADAMLALFSRTASPRVTVLLTSAQELLGRVVRDPALLSAITAETKPVPGVRVGDPGTWRGALVARALLGIAPSPDDVAVALAGDRLTGTAVALSSVVAEGGGATDTLRALLSGNSMVAAAAATAAQRVRTGRLASAVS